jgi:hypothetical protein
MQNAGDNWINIVPVLVGRRGGENYDAHGLYFKE